MSELFTEDQVKELAQKTLDKVSQKVREEFVDSFYDQVSMFLEDHYQNARERIDDRLIEQIAERFRKDPSGHKFRDLRLKMFEENQESVTALLTDEVLERGVERVILEHTNKEYWFEWKWKDQIAQFIANNWELFENDKRIGESFVRRFGQQEGQIKYLKERLGELDE